MYVWVLAAILTICVASFFTACSDDDDKDTPAVEQTEAEKNRDKFIEHTRTAVKDLAENLNFESWETANSYNMYFNQYVLANKDFENSLVSSIFHMLVNNIQEVEEGSELAAMGFNQYIDLNLSNFKYRFKMKDGQTDFYIEEADAFEIVLNGYNPKTQQIENGLYKVNLKMNGTGRKRVVPVKNSDGAAIVVTMPSELQFTLSNMVSGTWHADFSGNISYKLPEDATDNSQGYTAEAKINSDIPAAEGKKGDKTELALTINSDRVNGQANVQGSWTQNGRKMLDLSLQESGANMGGISNLDMSQFSSTSSIFEVIASILSTRSIDATVTLLDDLSVKFNMSNLQKLLELDSEYRTVGRNYASKETIDEYTKKLNELVKAEISCKGTNQTLPMRLATTPVGIDYWAVYQVKFSEEDYVSLLAMLDRKTFAYVLNIMDHSTDHLQQSVIIVRQLIEFAVLFNQKLAAFGASLDED